MKKLFVNKNIEITSQEFRVFLEQFSRGENIESISLCKNIKSKWWDFIDGRNFAQPKTIKRLNGNCLPSSNPPSKPGVYGIFASFKTSDFPQCFYVGISARDLRSRVRTHLSTDIKKNYRSAFKRLEEAEEIYICSCSVPESENKNRIRQELELLEHCLIVLLRPRFLLLAAMNA